MYPIDKGLSGVPTEAIDHLDFALAGEDRLDYWDDFMLGEVAAE